MNQQGPEACSQLAAPYIPRAKRRQPKFAFTLAQTLIVLLGGLAASLLVVGHPLGLGFVLSCYGVGLAWFLTTKPKRTFNLTVFGTLALALIGMVVLRTAFWLILIDLVAALLALSLALTDTETLTGYRRSVAALVSRAIRAVIPVYNGVSQMKVGRLKNTTVLIRLVLVAAVPLALFTALFMSADAVFQELVSSSLPDVSLGSVDPIGRIVVGGLFASLTAGLIWLYVDRSQVDGAKTEAGFRLSAKEWMVGLSVTNLLFAAFVAVQLTTLFGGNEHILSTEGLTYAEYARSGFTQLVVTVLLVLLLFGFTLDRAVIDSSDQRLVLRVQLALLCVLSAVILGSALYRVDLLEETYGLTRIRLLGHATTIWSAGVLAMLLVAAVRLSGRWLPRWLAIYTLTFLLLFSAANPERLIAKYNVDRYEQTGRIDTRYLSNLGADARPQIARLPDYMLADAFGHPVCWTLNTESNYSLLAYNVSRSKASKVYRSQRVRDSIDCIDSAPF